MSSLSTITMVLVYILTTSRQLNAMRKQLDEMKFRRILQSHPLPLFSVKERECCSVAAPRCFTSPPDFALKPDCHTLLEYNVENVGNGPAVCIDIIPTINFMSETKKPKIKEACRRINSLKQGEITKEFQFQFISGKEVLQAVASEEQNPVLRLEILYKNLLGASFVTLQEYELWLYPEEIEKSKAWMKAFETLKIDFSREISQHDSLRKKGRDDEAHELFTKIDTDFVERVGRQRLQLCLSQVPGSFSVKILTREEYERELSRVYYPRLLGVYKEEKRALLETARKADQETIKCKHCGRKTLHVYHRIEEKWVCTECWKQIEQDS